MEPDDIDSGNFEEAQLEAPEQDEDLYLINPAMDDIFGEPDTEEVTAQAEEDEEEVAEEVVEAASKGASPEQRYQAKLQEVSQKFAEQLAVREAQFQKQLQAQAAQSQTYMQQLAQQNAMLVEALKGPAQQEDESKLSEVERFRRQVLKDAEEQLKGKFADPTKITQLEQKLAKMEQKEAAQKAEATRNKIYSNVSRVVDTVFGDADPEALKTLKPELEKAYFAYAVGVNSVDAGEPETIEGFKKLVDSLLRAKTGVKKASPATKSLPKKATSKGQPASGAGIKKPLTARQLALQGKTPQQVMQYIWRRETGQL